MTDFQMFCAVWGTPLAIMAACKLAVASWHLLKGIVSKCRTQSMASPHGVAYRKKEISR